MLDFIADILGELFFEGFAGIFSGLFGSGDRKNMDNVSFVPRLPARMSGLDAAKGGN